MNFRLQKAVEFRKSAIKLPLLSLGHYQSCDYLSTTRPSFGVMPAVGELVRCTDGSWMVRPPQRCPRWPLITLEVLLLVVLVILNRVRG